MPTAVYCNSHPLARAGGWPLAPCCVCRDILLVFSNLVWIRKTAPVILQDYDHSLHSGQDYAELSSDPVPRIPRDTCFPPRVAWPSNRLLSSTRRVTHALTGRTKSQACPNSQGVSGDLRCTSCIESAKNAPYPHNINHAKIIRLGAAKTRNDCSGGRGGACLSDSLDVRQHLGLAMGAQRLQTLSRPQTGNDSIRG